jgi:hypothetical protein
VTAVIIIIVVVVLAALAAGGYVLYQRRRSQQLQEQFGPEYDKVVERSDSKSEAESELAARKKRHDSLELNPLDEQTRQKHRDDWQRIQAGFVDDPGGSVEHADSLVVVIMRDRGYPIDDFHQRADDLSVEHPRVVEHYREARRVTDAHRNGSAGTEDLRGAVTSYRNLVEALLDESGGGGEGGRHDGASGPAASTGSSGDGRPRSTSGAGESTDHQDGSRS